MMPDSILSNKIREFYREHDLKSDTPVTVGFSGGPDSTALTVTLLELGLPLKTVHVCHHLRGETAQRDAEFCRDFCTHYGIPFVRRDVYVREHLEGRSVEEAARQLRYEALLEECPDGSYLAVAHNANDAVETALFNLARGTGAAGLGIAPIRELSRTVTLIRPVLRCTREEILRELADRGLPFVEDETNNEEDASRNILRHACIPAMLRVNPRAVENAAAALERIREDHETLNRQARELATIPASAKALREAPAPVAARAFLMLYHHKDMTERHIKALHALCATSAGSGRIALPGKLWAVREYDELRIISKKTAIVQEELPPRPLTIGETTVIPEMKLQITVKRTKRIPENSDCFYNIYVDSEVIHGILSVRRRALGDTLRLVPGGCHRNVKKAMIDARIPQSLRESCPVILCGGEILAVRGLGAAAEYAGKPGCVGLVLSFEPINGKSISLP